MLLSCCTNLIAMSHQSSGHRTHSVFEGFNFASLFILFFFISSPLKSLNAYVELYTTFPFPLCNKIIKSNSLTKSNFITLENKTSVQEVRLLINQEHEIFHSVSNSILLLKFIGILKGFQKGNVYNHTVCNVYL